MQVRFWGTRGSIPVPGSQTIQYGGNTSCIEVLSDAGTLLIIDCGTEDFFYEVNKNLHEQLLYRNIPHDYIARPGSHNWNYWTNAVQYQLLFMHRFFESR